VQLRGRGRPPNSARTEAERADAKARRAALAAGDRNLSFNSTNSFGAGSPQSSFGGLTPRSGVGGGTPGGKQSCKMLQLLFMCNTYVCR